MNKKEMYAKNMAEAISFAEKAYGKKLFTEGDNIAFEKGESSFYENYNGEICFDIEGTCVVIDEAAYNEASIIDRV